MQTECIELIRQDYTFVTASKRQARFVRHQYANAMLALGQSVWQSPAIVPWQTWLALNWEEQQFSRQSGQSLLNTTQQRRLWQTVIEGSEYAQQFLQINPVVQQAMRTYELCRSWQVPVFPEGVYLNEDAYAFRSWARQFEALLAKNHWVDTTGIAAGLTVEQLAVTGVVFYGFDEYTPEQLQLIERMREAGTDVVLLSPPCRNRSVRYLKFGDAATELLAAAHWARHIVTTDSKATVGIIVPDLKQNRQVVARVFEQVFNPASLLGQSVITSPFYSLAPGRPLSDYPLIHAAMEILALGNRKHSIERMSGLLRSMYIGGAEAELQARAQFDVALRRSGEQQWQLKNLFRYCDKYLAERERATVFISMLRSFVDALQSTRKRQSPGDWAGSFTEWLKLFGWPGERQTDSDEYQTLAAWRDALSELASLNNVMPVCDYPTALFHLGRVLAENSFQPETVETQVQICGLPGAAGMQYDFIWITGINDQVWPGTARPNPFIPATLQREAGLPDATADIALARIRKLADQLIASASEIMFSYTAFQGEQECRQSPLLQKYPVEQGAVRSDADYKQLLFESSSMESFDDGSVPMAADGKASGGTSILSDQAACPFRAFARHRLYAQGIPESDIGLDPMVRGQLVHSVLQQVWQQLCSSERLAQIPLTELHEMVAGAVTSVVREQADRQPETFTRQFSAIESHRLTGLVLNWLEFERKRVPFKVIAVEKKQETSLSGLGLRLRIDRIDQLEDGRLVILDYKTGNVKAGDWDGQRPNAPQLPLYAICSDTEVAALAYAELKKGQTGFTGLAITDDLLPGVKAAVDKETGEDLFAGRLHQWESILADLATEFVNGRADVSPKDTNSCRNCDLHSLCRVHELSAIVQEVDDEN